MNCVILYLSAYRYNNNIFPILSKTDILKMVLKMLNVKP